MQEFTIHGWDWPQKLEYMFVHAVINKIAVKLCAGDFADWGSVLKAF
jgi:hypothetical protein